MYYTHLYVIGALIVLAGLEILFPFNKAVLKLLLALLWPLFLIPLSIMGVIALIHRGK